MNKLFIIIGLLICTSLNANTHYFGDFRFRYEIENQEFKDNPRDRQRIRARIGAKYNLNNLEVGIRLATGAGAIQSPHQTLGDNETTDNAEFGLDKAYLKYKFGSSTLTLGKNSINMWRQNEVLMDGDYSPEGISYSYTRFGLVLNAGYYLMKENSWDYGIGKDENLLTHQLLFSKKIKHLSTKLALTNAILTSEIMSIDSVSSLESTITSNIFSTQFKLENHILGFDYHLTDANLDNSAFIAMFKTKLWGHSLGVWYFDIAENGVISHNFTQDNFPKTDQGFSGFRFQIGFKLKDSINTDIRYYMQKMDSDKEKINRLQLNLNVKF
jgi:hypothetical protein